MVGTEGSSTVYHSYIISHISDDKVVEIGRFVRHTIQGMGLTGSVELEQDNRQSYYVLRLIGKKITGERIPSVRTAEGDRINAAIVQIAEAVEKRFLAPAVAEVAARSGRGGHSSFIRR